MVHLSQKWLNLTHSQIWDIGINMGQKVNGYVKGEPDAHSGMQHQQ